MESSLKILHPSIGDLKNLKMVSFFGNNINELPSEIGNLKNLAFLNIAGNPITKIPDSIKYLDKKNGGNLHRIAVDKKDIGEENYLKLIKLLPSVKFN